MLKGCVFWPAFGCAHIVYFHQLSGDIWIYVTQSLHENCVVENYLNIFVLSNDPIASYLCELNTAIFLTQNLVPKG